MNHGLTGQKAVLKYQKNIKEATNLTKYAIITRYPGEYDEITRVSGREKGHI